jgi:DNA-binding NtrC family response regulator
MKHKVMVVEDTPEIRELLNAVLKSGGYDSMLKRDAAELKDSFSGAEPAVVLLDLNLPDGHGLELLPLVKKQWPDTQVVVLSGQADLDTAVEATKRGAYDFQAKPFEAKALLVRLEKALEHRQMVLEKREAIFPIFQSASMRNIVKTIERVAPSDVSILITGESGTGKEVIADLIHKLSNRSKGPLVKINCAALPRELIESELFGSVKGAYTGANADREGLFRQAESGSLFLDEISEMPIDTQSKLLRVLQEKEVRPVGGKVSYKSDCRIIAATNRPTDVAIKEGKLREDLFYRISAISVYLPPLRERREDILPLATTFLKRYAAQADRNINGFTKPAAEMLSTIDWPGNIRQLQNEIQRTVLMCENNVIDVQDLSITTVMSTNEVEDLTLMEAMERNTIEKILKETGGNKLETAKRLGIGRQTLYNKIKVYGIEA